MATTLSDDALQAFRSGDRNLAQDALGHVVNRAARLMAEANRQRLTEFWKDLAAAHYEAEGMELAPELREERGYLEAVVHLTKAVRDLSDDLEAIEKVKKCVHGPAILAALKDEGTVRHGELADRLGISAPSLTQAMRALADSRTVTSTVHGKFKYFSLTSLGSVVAERLKNGPSAGPPCIGHLPENGASRMPIERLFQEALSEAEQHKYVESENAGHDVGGEAIDDWQRRHWTDWLRHRWVEHLMGLRCWEEFEVWRFGRLRALFPDQEPLLAELADKVRSGAENADILWWAAMTDRDIRLVVSILTEMDTHRIRFTQLAGDWAAASSPCGGLDFARLESELDLSLV